MLGNLIPASYLSSLPAVAITFLGSIFLIVMATRVGIYSAISLLAKTWNWRQDTVGKLLGYVTSFPELITTIYLVLAGLYVSALYNIMSSNVINIIFVVGVMLLVFKRISKEFIRSLHLPTLALTLIVPLALIFFPGHTNHMILVIIGLSVFYVSYLIYTSKKLHEPTGPVEYHPLVEMKPGFNHVLQKTLLAVFMLIAGIGVILISGDLFSLSSQILITEYGAPELLVGVVTGIVTSLPELTTFYISAKTNKEKPSGAYQEIGHNLLASNAGNIFVGYNLALILVLLL